jgi:ABC-type multidrug transport system permease subunit
MGWALSLYALGMGIIGLVSLRRRPGVLVGLCFIVLALIMFGLLSLGMTGSGLEQAFRPLIRLLGLYPESEKSFWRISMMLSLLAPLGLLLAYGVSYRLQRAKVALFLIVFLIYCFVCDVVVHILIRAI